MFNTMLDHQCGKHDNRQLSLARETGNLQLSWGARGRHLKWLLFAYADWFMRLLRLPHTAHSW